MNEFRLDIALALVMFLWCFALHTSRVENTVESWAIEENGGKRGNTSELFSHFKWLDSKLSHQFRVLWGGMLNIQTTCKCIPWNNMQTPSHKHHWGERKRCFFSMLSNDFGHKGSVKAKRFLPPGLITANMCCHVDRLSGLYNIKPLNRDAICKCTKGEVHLKFFTWSTEIHISFFFFKEATIFYPFLNHWWTIIPEELRMWS